MGQPQRQRAIDRFRSEPAVLVCAMSLRAGGLGLNLTEASLVVILDPWWNPAVEEQARAGQMMLKPVSVESALLPSVLKNGSPTLDIY